ncbi:4'-phosphopantetheinyl transferase family protein [Legionella dresdenensis]|uniref:4'-phosphopantetheinyl transferase family protein n=1 Tax=Legionella dresdenensis TaxID=450200 RepID=A0ABV8CCC2_9GAMM
MLLIHILMYHRFVSLQAITPENCQLQADKIDIWQFSLNQLLPIFENKLSIDEQERANRFHFEKHRRRFTAARATLRIILASYLACKPEQIVFNYNCHGKPGISHASGIEFNLSHSGELALLAVGLSPVGIDLEFFSERPYLGIAKNLFSGEEYDSLSNLPPDLIQLAFFHIWAQKEAFIKACGLGLSYPTSQFTVPSLPTTDQLISDELHNKHWHMLSFMAQPDCCAAVCYEPSIKTLEKIIIEQ